VAKLLVSVKEGIAMERRGRKGIEIAREDDADARPGRGPPGSVFFL
jgi:hypothetical protein